MEISPLPICTLSSTRGLECADLDTKLLEPAELLQALRVPDRVVTAELVRSMRNITHCQQVLACEELEDVQDSFIGQIHLGLEGQNSSRISYPTSPTKLKSGSGVIFAPHGRMPRTQVLRGPPPLALPLLAMQRFFLHLVDPSSSDDIEQNNRIPA